MTAASPPRLLTRIAADSSVIRFTLPRRPGQLTYEQAAAIGPRISSLRTEPAMLQIRIGDSVSVQSLLRVMAIDSAGVELGELHGYDFSPRGAGLWLLRDGRMWARDLGVVQFTVSYARSLWRGDPSLVPKATVPIVITATGSTSPPVGPR